MRLRWAYALKDLDEDTVESGDAPLVWNSGRVHVPTCSWEHDRETRARDASERGYRFDVHSVASNGQGRVDSFSAPSALIPQCW